MHVDDIEFSDLTTKQLEEIRDRLDKEIRKAHDRDRHEILAAAQQMAKERGLSLDEVLYGRKREAPRRGVVPPRYRNPEDHKVTWSGRGRKPAWFTDALERGVSEEAMEIPESELGNYQGGWQEDDR